MRAIIGLIIGGCLVGIVIFAAKPGNSVPDDITSIPCWSDYSVPCTPDQYQRIAEWNCTQIIKSGAQCQIVTGTLDGQPMPPHVVTGFNQILVGTFGDEDPEWPERECKAQLADPGNAPGTTCSVVRYPAGFGS
jgi:hypothetical protein